MAAAAGPGSERKLVQQDELRRLMREKQRQSAGKKRIEAPFAKYPFPALPGLPRRFSGLASIALRPPGAGAGRGGTLPCPPPRALSNKNNADPAQTQGPACPRRWPPSSPPGPLHGGLWLWLPRAGSGTSPDSSGFPGKAPRLRCSPRARTRETLANVPGLDPPPEQ